MPPDTLIPTPSSTQTAASFLPRKLIIGLLVGATVVFVGVLALVAFSGADYVAAYNKIPLPADVSSGGCKFGTVAGSMKRKLECTTTFSSTVNSETTAVARSFDNTSYTLDRDVIQDNGTGVVWAGNGTWLIEINMSGKKTQDGFVGHYDAVMERGGDFGQFN